MNCDEAAVKCQMLTDDELDENEIGEVIEHISTCRNCREEYTDLLKLKHKLTAVKNSAPDEDWFESLSKRRGRRFFNRFALILLALSYLLFFGYTVFNMMRTPSEDLISKIVVAGAVVSVIILFVSALIDRIRESRTDRYKEVMK